MPSPKMDSGISVYYWVPAVHTFDAPLKNAYMIIYYTSRYVNANQILIVVYRFDVIYFWTLDFFRNHSFTDEKENWKFHFWRERCVCGIWIFEIRMIIIIHFRDFVSSQFFYYIPIRMSSIW